MSADDMSCPVDFNYCELASNPASVNLHPIAASGRPFCDMDDDCVGDRWCQDEEHRRDDTCVQRSHPSPFSPPVPRARAAPAASTAARPDVDLIELLVLVSLIIMLSAAMTWAASFALRHMCGRRTSARRQLEVEEEEGVLSATGSEGWPSQPRRKMRSTRVTTHNDTQQSVLPSGDGRPSKQRAPSRNSRSPSKRGLKKLQCSAHFSRAQPAQMALEIEELQPEQEDAPSAVVIGPDPIQRLQRGVGLCCVGCISALFLILYGHAELFERLAASQAAPSEAVQQPKAEKSPMHAPPRTTDHSAEPRRPQPQTTHVVERLPWLLPLSPQPSPPSPSPPPPLPPPAPASVVLHTPPLPPLQHAERKCPLRVPPLGLLYTHISKTGGTSMKAALQHVVAPGWYTQHDDVDIDTETGGHMVVSEADAAAHFVIANMRRPCDYWLSKWSYLSDLAQLGIGWALRTPNRGVVPPYTGLEDRARFKEFVKDMGEHPRVSLTSQVFERIGAWVRPHCWVRTHRLTNDLMTCLTHYVDECGGEGVELQKAREWIQQHLDHVHAQTSSTSEAHATCSSFFDESNGGADMAVVLQHDGWAIAPFELERCCTE